MKIKRQKAFKKDMKIYIHSYNFRTPYQIIVDGNFIQAAILMKADLYGILAKVFGNEIKLFTTNCIQVELKNLGIEMRDASYVSQDLEKRKCNHYPPKNAGDCIKGLIGDDNYNRLIVATQHKQLRSDLRRIPAVPLIYLNKSVSILEPPSPATTRKAALAEIQKTLPKWEELQKLSIQVTKDNSQDASMAVMHHKKRLKAPNPLSCKKKKSIPQKITSDNKKRKASEIEDGEGAKPEVKKSMIQHQTSEGSKPEVETDGIKKKNKRIRKKKPKAITREKE